MAVFAIVALVAGIGPTFVDAPNDLYAYLGRVIALPVAYFLFFDLRRFTDLRPAQVAAVEGEAQRTMRQKKTGNWEYAIIVGGLRLIVLKPVYDALAEPYRYRVYYATRRREFLNVEPIGELPAASDFVEA